MAPWVALGRYFVILEGFGGRSFLMTFLVGGKSADESLKIRPGSSRVAAGNTLVDNKPLRGHCKMAAKMLKQPWRAVSQPFYSVCRAKAIEGPL
jgi:hypothetical protein